MGRFFARQENVEKNKLQGFFLLTSRPVSSMLYPGMEGMTMETKRALVYGRTSSDDEEGQGGSVQDQIRDGRTLCQREGYSVLEEIAEPNRSGRTYPTGAPMIALDSVTAEYVKTMQHQTRDGLARVLDLASRREFEVLVVRDLKRLDRGLTGSHLHNFLSQELKRYGVKIHSVTDGLKDCGDWDYQFMSGVETMAADKETTKRAMLAAKKLHEMQDVGGLPGRSFFGWRNDGIKEVQGQKVYRISPVESEQAIVRQVFKWYLSGVSCREIVRRLRAKHPKPRNWTDADVRNVVDRPAYAGLARTADGKLVQSRFFSAIVPVEDWKAVQAIRRRHAPNRGRPATVRPHPLTGFLRCGVCGHALNVHILSGFGAGAYKYRCPHAYEASGDCRRVAIGEVPMIAFTKGLAALAVAARAVKVSDPVANRAALVAELAELKAREDALFDSADISSEQVRRQASRLADRIKALETQVATLDAGAALAESKQEATAFLAGFPQRIQACGLDGDALHNALAIVLDSIQVHPDRLVVVLKSGEQFQVQRRKWKNQNLPPCVVVGDDGQRITFYCLDSSCVVTPGIGAQEKLPVSQFKRFGKFYFIPAGVVLRDVEWSTKTIHTGAGFTVMAVSAV